MSFIKISLLKLNLLNILILSIFLNPILNAEAFAQENCISDEKILKMIDSFNKLKNDDKKKVICKDLLYSARCISLENFQTFMQATPIALKCFTYVGAEVKQSFENIAKTLSGKN